MMHAEIKVHMFKCNFFILTKPVVHVTHYNRLVTVVYPLINYKRGPRKVWRPTL